jgi:hypothetical protein
MRARILALVPFGCAVYLLASAVPVGAQDSAQTVRAAIPPQVTRPAAQAPLPASVAATDLDGVPNVRVDVTITYQIGQGPLIKRSASVLVAQGENGSLRSGNQVAVPSTSFVPSATAPKTEGSGATPVSPMTSFNYRAVGLNVDARRVRVSGSRAKMDLSVEVSTLDERIGEMAGRPPSFPSFSQSLSVILDSGKPLIIAQTSDFVDNVERRQTVEVKATILR